MCMFRKLKANEIKVRIQSVVYADKKTKTGCKGAIYLLYKDARCDMAILDETVKPANWQRCHTVINNNLFCKVGIKIEGEWVWKEDVGVESNTEEEKGQASDAFKRACTCWGIGRELYTSPFIYIKGTDDKELFNLKLSVKEIEYENDSISKLILVDDDDQERYSFGNKKKSATQTIQVKVTDKNNDNTKATQKANTSSNEQLVAGVKKEPTKALKSPNEASVDSEKAKLISDSKEILAELEKYGGTLDTMADFLLKKKGFRTVDVNDMSVEELIKFNTQLINSLNALKRSQGGK